MRLALGSSLWGEHADSRVELARYTQVNTHGDSRAGAGAHLLVDVDGRGLRRQAVALGDERRPPPRGRVGDRARVACAGYLAVMCAFRPERGRPCLSLGTSAGAVTHSTPACAGGFEHLAERGSGVWERRNSHEIGDRRAHSLFAASGANNLPSSMGIQAPRTERTIKWATMSSRRSLI